MCHHVDQTKTEPSLKSSVILPFSVSEESNRCVMRGRHMLLCSQRKVSSGNCRERDISLDTEPPRLTNPARSRPLFGTHAHVDELEAP